MDIYILNDGYQKIELIDEYSSFIWSERYSQYGDFELTIDPGSRLSELLKPGCKVTHSKTERACIVSNYFFKTDPDDKRSLVIKGRSLEWFFNDRLVKPNAGENWKGQGQLDNLIIDIVQDVFLTGEDRFDMHYNSSVDIVESSQISVKEKSLYEAVKEMCDTENLGFSVTVRPRTLEPRIRFGIYKGVFIQNMLFSSQMDNLTQESHLLSTEDFKNTAYVRCKDRAKTLTVYSPGTDPLVRGLDRKVMLVDANDLDSTTTTELELLAQMKQRGLEALSEQKSIDFYDGEISKNTNYIYGEDYYLGDVVSVVDEVGQRKKVRLSEYIWISDDQGIKSYPTFEPA